MHSIFAKLIGYAVLGLFAVLVITARETSAADKGLNVPEVVHIPLDLDIPGLGSVLMSEQPTLYLVQVPVRSVPWGEKRTKPNVKELGLQVWLLKKDGTAIPQKNLGVVEIGTAGAPTSYMIYNFEKVPTNQLAAIVLRAKGELYCRQIGPDKTVQHSSAARTPIDESLTKQISEVLIECQKIKTGMTRAQLLATFTAEGGISNAEHRTYVHRRCPYIKVDVDFVRSGGSTTEEQPTDTITKISKPFLDWSVVD